MSGDVRSSSSTPLDPNHWLKQLGIVQDVECLYTLLGATGRSKDDVMAIKLERMNKFIMHSRMSFLDEQWNLIDFLDLRITPRLAAQKITRANVVVRLENGPHAYTDWGWEFMLLLRKPLTYYRVVTHADSRRSNEWANETTRQVYFRMQKAIQAFDALLPTAVGSCWPYLNVEVMEFGFTFENEQDAVAFEALTLV